MKKKIDMSIDLLLKFRGKQIMITNEQAIELRDLLTSHINQPISVTRSTFYDNTSGSAGDANFKITGS